MKDCSSRDMPVAQRDKFSLTQCSKNNLEIEEMQLDSLHIDYEELIYAQLFMYLNIMSIVGMLVNI